jgi:hypothetical protein
MRNSNINKCWPFDPEENARSLPSMDVQKFRWWAKELDRKVKQRSPKKRSISELFAMAPQITTAETRSGGRNEDQKEKLDAPVQLERETITDDVEKKKKSKGKKRRIESEAIEAVKSKSDNLEGDEELKQKAIKERKRMKKKLKKKKKLEIQIHFKAEVRNKLLASISLVLTLFCSIELIKPELVRHSVFAPFFITVIYIVIPSTTALSISQKK